MKKAIYSLLAFTLFAGIAYAQAPQAVCYQALAMDGTGNQVPDRTISIRASILKGGASGQIYWQETHQPLTDEFSIFTINIGQGSYQGGILTAFSDFDWGNGEYWLRIEMDVNGGPNYSLMGATKMLSVPYALHANTAKNASEASVATTALKADTALFALNADAALVAEQADTALVALTALDDDDKNPLNEIQKLVYQNDSIQLVNANGVATPGGSIYFPDASPTNEIQTMTYVDGVLSLSNGGNAVDLRSSPLAEPGASADFPQGITGEHILLTTGNYQVPNNKVFYITAGGSSLKLNAFSSQINHPTTPNMPIFPGGTSITDCKCTGFLADTSFIVQPVIIDLTNNAGYTVPSGKVLIIKSGLPNDLPGRLILDGVELEFFRPNFTRGTRIVTIPESVFISKPVLYAEMYLTGFLIDKDI